MKYRFLSFAFLAVFLLPFVSALFEGIGPGGLLLVILLFNGPFIVIGSIVLAIIFWILNKKYKKKWAKILAIIFTVIPLVFIIWWIALWLF